MANRVVPKIEWSIVCGSIALPKPPEPEDALEIRPKFKHMPLENLPEISQGTLKALKAVGIGTVGTFLVMMANADSPLEKLTDLKGLGMVNAKRTIAAVTSIIAEDTDIIAEDTDPPPGPPMTIEGVPTGPLKELFVALDAATEVSRGQLELVRGYPRIVATEDRTFLVARWGGVRYMAHRLTLVRRDKRFHAVPPLSNKDTGMTECREER